MNINRDMDKIISKLSKIGILPKMIIKYGTIFFLFLLISGIVILVLNHHIISFNPYNDFIATSVIKTSFIILAEAIIGGLLMDYFFKK